MPFRMLIDAVADFKGPEGRLILGFLLIFLLSSAFSIFLAQSGYFLALLVWITAIILKKLPGPVRTDLDAFFLAYLLAEAVATVFAYNVSQSLLYMERRMLLIPIVYLLANTARSTATMKTLLGAMIVSALAVSLWSLRDLFLYLPEYIRFQRRLMEFQIYMTAGGIMMIACLMVLPFVLHRKAPPYLRLAAGLMLIPLGVNLFFTFTRSSWLGFLAGSLVIGFRRHRRLFLPLTVVLLVVIGVASPEVTDRMTSIFDPSHPNNITRVQMWTAGLRMFLDHPVFGIGDIGTEHLWALYAEPGWLPEGHLHNNLIMWLVTLGSVGFLVLCLLFWKIWKEMSRIERLVTDDWFKGSLSLGALAVIAGFHVNGLFEWNFGDAEIIMLVWAVTGLTLAAGRITTREGDRG